MIAFNKAQLRETKGEIRGERMREDFETDTRASTCCDIQLWILLCLRVILHIVWHMQVAHMHANLQTSAFSMLVLEKNLKTCCIIVGIWEQITPNIESYSKCIELYECPSFCFWFCVALNFPWTFLEFFPLKKQNRIAYCSKYCILSSIKRKEEW